MKKIVVLLTSALLFTAVSFACDGDKKCDHKDKNKKECTDKEKKSCCKKDAKDSKKTETKKTTTTKA